MKKTVVFGLLAALLVAPGAGMAESAVSGRVAGRLIAEALRWRVSGYKTNGRAEGNLRQGDSKEYQIKLERGKKYKILGACDGDCFGMDLSLNHNLLGELGSSKNKVAPVIDVGPTRLPLNVNLKVYMRTCKKEPCGYGVGVLCKD